MRLYRPKRCADCGETFAPTGPRALRCDPCLREHRLLSSREQTRRWRAANPEKAREQTREKARRKAVKEALLERRRKENRRYASAAREVARRRGLRLAGSHD